jgi:vancomycin resistance protein VanW
MMLRDVARLVVPFPVRVELVRLRRWPAWLRERPRMALKKAASSEYPHVLDEAASPLRRKHVNDERLQSGKERNVALAARKIDGIRIDPGQTFSYHHAVGRPSRLRGFRPGLELHDGEGKAGVGGGCCQLSNLLYLLALRSGMTIVERHRHALDLFPDHGRTVPFGCGATVFFNSADLRFSNPNAFPVVISLDVREGLLVGEIRCEKPPSGRIEVYEVDHHFHREEDAWWRENRLRRRLLDASGIVIHDEEVAVNRGRCLYDPENPDD